MFFGVFDWEANPGYLVAFNAEGTNQGSVLNKCDLITGA
jgi:hypothetical protein